eukprot:3388600-Alexandrium_andersonii.AAC.1
MVLAVTQQGKVSNMGLGPAWAFDSGKELVLDIVAWEKADKHRGAAECVLTLSAYMEKVGATGVAKQPWGLDEIKQGR